MTKPSSSQLGMPTALLDSICRPVPIGKQIGRGGEGAVYEVDGQPSLVAKVYHKKPLPDEQVAKLQAMVSCWSSPLETIAAWPRSILFDSVGRKPCGILMTKMDGAKALHELYGTTNRRRNFPDVGWHHLVLAARNTAAAFQTLHSANILVGDVNQGNLLVDKGMCVRMIDCDSFQLTTGGRTFSCPVGTPHFTPPELQSLKLRDVVRTVNHDRFGLAVLIFHLLFVGRHPFAGRFRGAGDLSIEKAIAERRFAFSKNREETLVDPPPASLLLDDLPPSLAALFESAFRGGGEANPRPTPLEWVQELESLMKSRRTCSFDSIHVYYSQLGECPWCRIEDGGGPSFFVPAGGMTAISADRLASLEDRIWDLQEPRFPDLPSQRLVLPSMPVLKAPKIMPKRAWPDWNADLLVASWAVCFVGAIISGTAGGWMLAAGTLLSLALAASLIFSKQTQTRRSVSNDYAAWLQKKKAGIEKLAKLIDSQHRQREQTFDRSTEEIKNEIQLYRTAGENLQDVIGQLRESEKAEFLRGFSLRDGYRNIRNLTPSQVIMLESFSVETANDVDRIRLYGIPSIDPETVVELLQWRWDIEQKFVFNPEHGITLAEAGTSKELAVRRFKISQARKILTGSKQVDSLSLVGNAELGRAFKLYDGEIEQWKNRAKQFRDFQSARHRFERLINTTPVQIVGLALGVLFAAGVAYLFRR